MRRTGTDDASRAAAIPRENAVMTRPDWFVLSSPNMLVFPEAPVLQKGSPSLHIFWESGKGLAESLSESLDICMILT